RTLPGGVYVTQCSVDPGRLLRRERLRRSGVWLDLLVHSYCFEVAGAAARAGGGHRAGATTRSIRSTRRAGGCIDTSDWARGTISESTSAPIAGLPDFRNVGGNFGGSGVRIFAPEAAKSRDGSSAAGIKAEFRASEK